MNDKLKGILILVLGFSYFGMSVFVAFAFLKSSEVYNAMETEGMFFFLTFLGTIGVCVTHYGIGKLSDPIKFYSAFHWMTKKFFVMLLYSWIFLVICILNWISFTYANTISLIGIFYLLFFSLFPIFYQYLFHNELSFRNHSTKRFYAICPFDQFYINGVDVLNDDNRTKIKGKSITLMIPKSKIVFATTEEIFLIQGKNFPFQLAFHKANNGNLFIYNVGYRDYYKIVRNDLNFYIKDEYIQNRELLRNYWANHLFVPAFQDPDTYYSNFYLYRCKIVEHENYYIPEVEKYSMNAYRFSIDGEIRFWLPFPIHEELACETHEEATSMAKSWIEDINCYLGEEFDPNERDYDLV